MKFINRTVDLWQKAIGVNSHELFGVYWEMDGVFKMFNHRYCLHQNIFFAPQTDDIAYKYGLPILYSLRDCMKA